MYVLYQGFLAAARGNLPPIVRRSNRFPVPNVVLTAHRKTVRRQEARKVVVAFNVFAHTVRYLHNRTHQLPCRRHPQHTMAANHLGLLCRLRGPQHRRKREMGDPDLVC